MVGVLGHQHLGHHALGGQSALDQPWRRRGLDHLALTGAAGVLRAVADDDLVLRRHDVEALGDILADHMHRAGAAGAGRRGRFDPHLHLRQMVGQRGTLLAALARAMRLQLPVGLFLLALDLGQALLQVLEGQLQLVLVQLFGPGGELQAP